MLKIKDTVIVGRTNYWISKGSMGVLTKIDYKFDNPYFVEFGTSGGYWLQEKDLKLVEENNMKDLKLGEKKVVELIEKMLVEHGLIKVNKPKPDLVTNDVCYVWYNTTDLKPTAIRIFSHYNNKEAYFFTNGNLSGLSTIWYKHEKIELADSQQDSLVSYWMATDLNNKTYLFENEPYRENGYIWTSCDSDSDCISLGNNIDDQMWDDEPIEVKLVEAK